VQRKVYVVEFFFPKRQLDVFPFSFYFDGILRSKYSMKNSLAVKFHGESKVEVPDGKDIIISFPEWTKIS